MSETAEDTGRRSAVGLSMDEVAAEVARDIADGSCVNLGIGLPTRVASHVPIGRELVFHSENGILGMGPPAPAGNEDWHLIDAGKAPVTILAGGSYLSHADSFALIRGGYIDVSIMGAYQVSVTGDLANWSAGVGTPAVGGAMDLASGARSVRVLMRHDDTDRGPRLLDRCTLPLTAAGKVSRIYTDLGIFVIGEGSFVAVGLATDIEQVRKRTGAHVEVAADCVVLPRATAAPLAPPARK